MFVRRFTYDTKSSNDALRLRQGRCSRFPQSNANHVDYARFPKLLESATQSRENGPICEDSFLVRDFSKWNSGFVLAKTGDISRPSLRRLSSLLHNLQLFSRQANAFLTQ